MYVTLHNSGIYVIRNNNNRNNNNNNNKTSNLQDKELSQLNKVSITGVVIKLPTCLSSMSRSKSLEFGSPIPCCPSHLKNTTPKSCHVNIRVSANAIFAEADAVKKISILDSWKIEPTTT